MSEVALKIKPTVRLEDWYISKRWGNTVLHGNILENGVVETPPILSMNVAESYAESESTIYELGEPHKVPVRVFP
jgi:hypothetical protein